MGDNLNGGQPPLALFTRVRRETVRKVPEGSTTQLQEQAKQCFSAHVGLRIPAKSTLRASLAPFSDSLRRRILGTSRPEIATWHTKIVHLDDAPKRDLMRSYTTIISVGEQGERNV
jgi:hypothetical protein